MELPTDVVDPDTLMQSFAIYTKPVCEKHGEILIKACKKCDRLICNECDLYDADCKGISLHHVF